MENSVGINILILEQTSFFTCLFICLLAARQRREQASMIRNTGTSNQPHITSTPTNSDSRLESMATQVKDVLPQVPITVIRKDISMLVIVLKHSRNKYFKTPYKMSEYTGCCTFVIDLQKALSTGCISV